MAEMRSFTKSLKALIALAAVFGLFASSTVQASEAAAMRALPEWSRLEKLFVPPQGSQPGSLLSQGDVTPFFDQVKKLGWNVPDRAAILDSMLPDNDPLVSELRSSQGKALAAQIQKMSGAYDKLDRIIRMPNGQATVHDLTRSKDGYKLVEYLTSTKGGTAMGKMLSKTSKDDFNQPTGHIYTAEVFLARVKKSYDEAAAREAAGKNTPAKPVAKTR